MIAIDNWKEKKFRELLDAKKIVYTVGPGLTSDTKFLYVLCQAHEYEAKKQVLAEICSEGELFFHNRKKDLN